LRNWMNGAFITYSASSVRMHMLKSSDWKTGDPETRVTVSPCARLIVHSRWRMTSNVIGSSSGSTSSCSASRGDRRARQSSAGR